MHSRAARGLLVRPLALFLTLTASACGHQPSEFEARDAGTTSAPAVASPVTAQVQGQVQGQAQAPAPPRSIPARPSGAETFNAEAIDWKAYDSALKLARKENKPVLLVVYTTWCPHCKNYSHVFDDPRVVDKARSFEMVKVDSDASPEVAGKYTPDGGYIPRTFFLAPDGTLSADIHPARPRFQYFYDEQDPSGLLAAMDTALTRPRR
ncbi:MAG TPA: thioredoxin family protein [Polyangiaceae bacterium]